MRKTFGVIGFCLFALPEGSVASFRYFEPMDTAAVPKTLSATGFFPDMAAKTALPEAVHFEINAALWSDGAWKQRWILPPPGKTIPYVDTADFFAYPESTVFVKNFWLESREGDPGSRVLWETRLLMKRSGAAGERDWHGFSYRWNKAQNEAQLVPLTADFDTLFHYTDASGRRTYKRWRFPSTACNSCHWTVSAQDASGRKVSGRAVLGFYPAQLKRPSAETAGRNQVSDFFARGVFTGTAPDSTALARRFIGILESTPPPRTEEDRWTVLDTKARSYLAANCSGCHGYRGIAIGVIGDKKVNFDFYNLSPAIPFAHFTTQTFSLSDTTTFLPTQDPYGRAAYQESVVMAGLDTSAGKPWHFELPTHAGDPSTSVIPALLYPGYPSVTELLYRQVRRASALMDSILLFRSFSISAANGDTAAIAKMNWLFNEPWGSIAWEDTLASHGWSLDSVFTMRGEFADGRHFWHRAPEQMPELGTYLPDTAALNVLAEWVRQYRSPVNIRARIPKHPGVPRIIGRFLSAPVEWNYSASLADLHGRQWALIPVRPGIYRLPDALRPGVYFLRSGSVSFRITLLF